MKLQVNHLTRVEGHAHLVIDAENGILESCRLEIVESPRFFEALLKGRSWKEVATIVSRVCGVCSNSHTLASLAATEKAFGIEVSDQTRSLRRLLLSGEILQSHLLQLYFMTVPDYLGVPSLFSLANTRRDLVSRALRLKRLANRLCEVVGGRPVHPVTPTVGGFFALPEAADLKALRQEMVGILPELEQTVALFADFAIPEFSRPGEYLCLDGKGDYPATGADLVFAGGLKAEVAGYDQLLEEFVVPHSTAKHVRTASGSYAVGPLARFKNAHRSLSSMAQRVQSALGLDRDISNPYHTTLARLVEVVHFLETSMQMIDGLLLDGLVEEPLPSPAGGGRGAAAVEAPRGTLFHSYAYDGQGRIEAVDCVIPTAQNLATIEADLYRLLPQILDNPADEIQRQAEMLIRAYDPCISCSTHLARLDFR